jgi:DNA-binding CsgD family transcriptional regulator
LKAADPTGQVPDSGSRLTQGQERNLISEDRDIQDRRPTARLSEIDRRILRLVAQGRSSKEIAQLLDRSPLTIDSRLKEVCARLGADNRVQAATMLLVDEAAGTPQDLGGPQSWRVAIDDPAPPAVGEDGASFVGAPPASGRPGASEADRRAGGGEAADQTDGRSLLRIVRMVMLVLVGLACAAFFLASAIEAGQGVFQSVRGVR